MPSSLNEAATTRVHAWQPMQLDELSGHADSTGTAVTAGSVTAVADTTCVFEPTGTVTPARESFAVSPSIGIPEDILRPARTAAQASGYADGWAAGMRDARAATADRLAADQRTADAELASARQRHQQALAALGAAAARIDAQHVTAATDIEEQIIAAALAIAEALVGQALADDSVRAPAALARALSLTSVDADVTVHVSGADFAVLAGTLGSADDGAASSRELHHSDGRRTITILPDPQLADGDATAHCGATDIDARISTGIERVRQVLAP